MYSYLKKQNMNISCKIIFRWMDVTESNFFLN